MDTTIKLINGVELPLIGLGTYPMRGEVLENVVKICNESGYHLYDSAWYYKNEQTLGKSFASLQIPREDLFIQSKLKAEQYLGRTRYLHLDRKTVARCYKDTLKRYGTSNPQLSSSASFLRLNVLSSLN